MTSCGRPTCQKCSTRPNCGKGRRCPKCQSKPKAEPNKFESDYNRTKGRVKR